MNTTINWPKKSREVVNFLMDSRRWNDFVFRDDDIVIATWSKSGTTWTQQIVSQLVFQGDAHVFGQSISPWIDFQLREGDPEMAVKQTHRRFMKTHLPLDALVFSPKAKYLYVGRDARDIIWSFHHHLTSFTPYALARQQQTAAMAGDMAPPPIPPDVRAFYNIFLANDANSPTSLFANVQGWWDARKLPNVMLLHYANLKADLPGEMRRIAKFLDIKIDESKFGDMLLHCSLEHMKDVGSEDEFLTKMFDGGARTFVNKGTNGRWRDVLSPEEVALADQIAAQRLTPDCAHWLKTGEGA
ncbi:MAG: sulfotransferase domain-containing protein [Alphaproteobacteria bacterium]|nr:sulfotransferase domain-containing protein [Alphaproteobacteria bacterium]